MDGGNGKGLMRQPAHKFLQEFPIDERDWPQPVVLRLRPRETAEPPQLSVNSARIGEAYAKGYEEGRSSARAEADAEIAELTATFELRIEETKRIFSQDVASKLGHDLQKRLDEIHATLEEQVVAALVPTLRHALSESSIRETAAALRELANDGEAIVIELTGPDELIEQVWQHFRELDQGRSGEPVVRFNPAEGTEIRASVNGTLIESRLGDWVRKIEEAVR
jgi:hypothetical protein